MRRSFAVTQRLDIGSNFFSDYSSDLLSGALTKQLSCRVAFPVITLSATRLDLVAFAVLLIQQPLFLRITKSFVKDCRQGLSLIYLLFILLFLKFRRFHFRFLLFSSLFFFLRLYRCRSHSLTLLALALNESDPFHSLYFPSLSLFVTVFHHGFFFSFSS
jgi:hypothetical protein